MKVEINNKSLAKALIETGQAIPIEDPAPPQPDYKGRLMSFFHNGKLVLIGMAHHQDSEGDWETEESDVLTRKGVGGFQTFISPDGVWRSAKQKPGTVTDEIDSPLPLTTLDMAKKYGTEWEG